MGNCIPCSSDRAAEDENIPIPEFEHNLIELKKATYELNKTKDKLTQKVKDEEEAGISMKPREEVQQWLDSVEERLEEVDQLIKNSDREIAEKKRPGPGGFSHNKNCKCSSTLNQRMRDMKDSIDDYKKKRKELGDQLVEKVDSAEQNLVHLLKEDLQALQIASNDLRNFQDHVRKRVEDDKKAGGMKQLERVEVWFTKVDLLIIEVNEIIRDAPEAIDKWSVGDFSDSMFNDKVEAKLKEVTRLRKEGEFPQVVQAESAESDFTESGEDVSQVEDDLKALIGAREDLWDLKRDLIARVNLEDKKDRKQSKEVDEWRKLVESKIAQVEEIQKLAQGGSLGEFREKVSKMLQDVTYLKKKKEDFSQLTDPELPEQVVEIELERPVGLEERLDSVWSVLMKNEAGILGLYGLGGVGKTTLLNYINNKFLNTPTDFDFVIWVVVPELDTIEEQIRERIVIGMIQEQIGERIGICVNGWKSKEVTEKAKDINYILRKKKFVLLLDDVWEKVDLEKAGVPIPKRQDGSKIVLTARSELVCIQMDARKRIKVETLPPDEAWRLFKERVGQETLDSDPAIPPLAELVAKECDGLPLALKVVAGAMASKKTAQEWRYALDELKQTASELQGIEADLFTRLKLSYDRLPDHRFRSCFIYCALFPAETKIYKDDLIDYWVSENFENAEKDITRARAHHILRHLVNVSLLEEDGRYVKMHNMIREVALWISRDHKNYNYYFLVHAGKCLSEELEVENWKGVKRTSLMKSSIQNLQLPDVSVCPDLCTLLLCHNSLLQEITGQISQFSSTLRVLDLSNTKVKELPGISGLSLLQYLNLSHTKIRQLPQELTKLEKLIYLNLEYNELHGSVPEKFLSSLSYLQVLRMFQSGLFFGEDSEMHIEELQHLKYLNVVSLTIRSGDAIRFYFSVKNMQSSTRALSLEFLKGSKSIEFSPTENMEQLEKLQISKNKHLEQINFCSKFSCFSSLREVEVDNCPCLLNLNWLVQAVNLEVLKVSKCENMKEIFDYTSENQMKIPKLEGLELENLPRLQKICSKSLSLPSMKRMKFLDCPMLKWIPLNLDVIEARKIVLEANKDWLMNVEWMDQVAERL